MSAKGIAQPADTQSEYPHSRRSETADDRDEIIRILRDEVDTLRRARQAKLTLFGGGSQLIERPSELFERSDSRSAIEHEERRIQLEEQWVQREKQEV